MKEFKDKVVVITGAGSGIGRALALHFANRQSRLAINDFNAEGLAETVGMLPSGIDVLQKVFDVSIRKEMYAFSAEVMNRYGQVDIVINNAGVALSKLNTHETTWEQYEWIIGINLWGMMYGSLAFLPYLRKRDESSLVNVSSIFGLHGVPGQAGYCTTKFGIRGFTESLSIEEEIAGSSVTVTSVHPGGIQTNIARNAQGADIGEEEMQRIEKAFITTPTKAAEVIAKGISKKKKRVVIGRDGKRFHFVSKLPVSWSRRLISNWVSKISD